MTFIQRTVGGEVRGQVSYKKTFTLWKDNDNLKFLASTHSPSSVLMLDAAQGTGRKWSIEHLWVGSTRLPKDVSAGFLHCNNRALYLKQQTLIESVGVNKEG